MPQAISDDRMQQGIERLLEMPLTLKSCGAAVWKPAPGLHGSDRHRILFLEYREEVDFVSAVALDWWNQTIRAREQIASNKAEVNRSAWMDRPAGPASFPGFVALIRDYWLSCDQLNDEVLESERVPPWTFLLGWLLDGAYQQAVSVLVCMPYWPIGLDREGKWV